MKCIIIFDNKFYGNVDFFFQTNKISRNRDKESNREMNGTEKASHKQMFNKHKLKMHFNLNELKHKDVSYKHSTSLKP